MKLLESVQHEQKLLVLPIKKKGGGQGSDVSGRPRPCGRHSHTCGRRWHHSPGLQPLCSSAQTPMVAPTCASSAGPGVAGLATCATPQPPSERSARTRQAPRRAGLGGRCHAGNSAFAAAGRSGSSRREGATQPGVGHVPELERRRQVGSGWELGARRASETPLRGDHQRGPANASVRGAGGRAGSGSDVLQPLNKTGNREPGPA